MSRVFIAPLSFKWYVKFTVLPRLFSNGFVAEAGLEPASFGLWDRAGTISSPFRNICACSESLLIRHPDWRLHVSSLRHIHLIPALLLVILVDSAGIEPAFLLLPPTSNQTDLQPLI